MMIDMHLFILLIRLFELIAGVVLTAHLVLIHEFLEHGDHLG